MIHTGIVKLSHMSVKDYLLSRPLGVGTTTFSIDEKLSHSLIAKTCLAYLLQFNNLDILNGDTINNFPLAQYAAEYWILHVRCGGDDWDDTEQKLVKTLFQPRHTAPFILWVRLYDIDGPWGWETFESKKVEIPSPIYYASLAGLLPAVQALVENGVDMNAQEGVYGNSLQAASYDGHEAVVSMLLEKGADVNAKGGKYGNALQAASYMGYEAIMDLLL